MRLENFRKIMSTLKEDNVTSVTFCLRGGHNVCSNVFSNIVNWDLDYEEEDGLVTIMEETTTYFFEVESVIEIRI